MQSNKPLTLMRPMDVLEALPCIPIYEGVLSQFNELSMAADQQELVSEMKMTLDPDTAELYFPENFSPVPLFR